MTSFAECDLTTDARWNDDHSAATHLRSPMTLTWVEMRPPVPMEALVIRAPGDFWTRFGALCRAAWDLGRCDPVVLEAGPGTVVFEDHRWRVEPTA